MKKTIMYDVNGEKVKKGINYIPVRYILAVFISLLEVLMILGIVVALSYYVPYFYLACLATEIYCVVHIIASDDNPDYKIRRMHLRLNMPLCEQAPSRHIKLICAWLITTRKLSVL